MRQFDHWWFPDDETHLPEWMTDMNRRVDGRLTYQYHKYEAAMKYCRPRRAVAVDVGAHVGLWSYWMARDFETLLAFEPREVHGDCWELNVAGRHPGQQALYACALGDVKRSVDLRTTPTCSGHTTVVLDTPATPTSVPMITLDSIALPQLDFLKIDCEGFEYFVVRGGAATIVRCRPTIIVEQKPGCGAAFGRGEEDAVALLVELGAIQVWAYGGDFVLTFED